MDGFNGVQQVGELVRPQVRRPASSAVPPYLLFAVGTLPRRFLFPEATVSLRHDRGLFVSGANTENHPMVKMTSRKNRLTAAHKQNRDLLRAVHGFAAEYRASSPESVSLWNGKNPETSYADVPASSTEPLR